MPETIDYSKITIGSGKLMQLAILFLQINFVCTVLSYYGYKPNLVEN